MDSESVEANETANIHFRSDREEFWNFATHAFGLAASPVAAYCLFRELPGVSPRLQISVIVYSITLICLYASSALSHYFHRGPLRSRFRKLDQAFIFLFIVAGFTPYFAADLTERWAWIGVAILWAMAITGFCSKLIFGHRVEGIATWTYLALGWLPALGMPFAKSLPFSSIWFIGLGGVFYTVGVGFLLWDKKHWYFHPIWHLFVLAGTFVHYWGILNCVRSG